MPQVKFSFFVNTKAQKCIGFGPGLQDEGTWGLPMLFMIQAKDGTGRNRTSGGDPFKVSVANSTGVSAKMVKRPFHGPTRHAHSVAAIWRVISCSPPARHR